MKKLIVEIIGVSDRDVLQELCKEAGLAREVAHLSQSIYSYVTIGQGKVEKEHCRINRPCTQRRQTTREAYALMLF